MQRKEVSDKVKEGRAKQKPHTEEVKVGVVRGRGGT